MSTKEIVIDVISSRSQRFSKFNALISNINSLISLVSNFKVKFVKHQTNMCHALARAEYSKTSRCIFKLTIFCIDNYLFNDLS
jgi:hypothetical protein